MSIESAIRESDTSWQAKQSVFPHVPRLQKLVLEAIRLGARSDDEIEQATGLRHQCASARRRELVIAGKVYDSGERVKTRSGRSAIHWKLRD